MKVCAVGFPRSGTKWLAEALCSIGLDVGHEKWRKDGGVGYMFSLNKNLEESLSADVCIHLVRDPRGAIGSAQRNLSVSTHLVNRFDGDWQRAWIHWNMLAEAVCFQAANLDRYVRRVKIEDAKEFIVELGVMLNLLGVDITPDFPPEDRNHRQDYPPMGWKGLKPGVIQLAHRYGYLQKGTE